MIVPRMATQTQGRSPTSRTVVAISQTFIPSGSSSGGSSARMSWCTTATWWRSSMPITYVFGLTQPTHSATVRRAWAAGSSRAPAEKWTIRKHPLIGSPRTKCRTSSTGHPPGVHDHLAGETQQPARPRKIGRERGVAAGAHQLGAGGCERRRQRAGHEFSGLGLEYEQDPEREGDSPPAEPERDPLRGGLDRAASLSLGHGVSPRAKPRCRSSCALGRSPRR